MHGWLDVTVPRLVPLFLLSCLFLLLTRTIQYAPYTTDAMLQSWTRENNFVNPPFRMISQILNKIHQEQCDATLIAPLWPSAPWFPLLLRLASDYFFVNPQSILPATQSGSAEPLKNKWTIVACRISGRSTPSSGI